ncbi:hypothetical protein SDC9_136445 [bioreactor metagenome]|uniref:Uncharacterized protein n=1 Tax=bioreactor metagenome TaxID=1076179 RepID=A0A645DJ53_9ZZZZ
MILKDPFSQPSLMLIKRKIPVFSFTHYRNASTNGGLWVDEISRIQRGSAGFTLVAVGIFVTAVRTLARDIAVGEKLVGCLIEILFRTLYYKSVFIIDGFEYFRSQFPVCFRSSAGIDIERNSKIFK